MRKPKNTIDTEVFTILFIELDEEGMKANIFAKLICMFNIHHFKKRVNNKNKA